MWTVAAILPNLYEGLGFEAEYVAIAGLDDPRVEAICAAHPAVRDFLSRFSDAFGVSLRPMTLIVEENALSREAILSFRDLAAMSVVPLGRAESTIYRTPFNLNYSDYFALYPWTPARGEPDTLVANTPAFSGVHVVDAFHGQSTPEVPFMQVKAVDTALFRALVHRWRRHYLGKRRRWADRALFRSLNVAFVASAVPSSVGTSLFDLGRSISLWVSAFEVLAHRGKKKDQGLESVLVMLDAIRFIEPQSKRRLYKLGKMTGRYPLTSKLYWHLNKARNDFLHGNRVSARTLQPKGAREGLYWLAPCLYRLALAGFLELDVEKQLAPRSTPMPAQQEAYTQLEDQRLFERTMSRWRPTRS